MQTGNRWMKWLFSGSFWPESFLSSRAYVISLQLKKNIWRQFTHVAKEARLILKRIAQNRWSTPQRKTARKMIWTWRKTRTVVWAVVVISMKIKLGPEEDLGDHHVTRFKGSQSTNTCWQDITSWVGFYNVQPFQNFFFWSRCVYTVVHIYIPPKTNVRFSRKSCVHHWRSILNRRLRFHWQDYKWIFVSLFWANSNWREQFVCFWYKFIFESWWRFLTSLSFIRQSAQYISKTEVQLSIASLGCPAQVS